jgi:antitoxin YqcF
MNIHWGECYYDHFTQFLGSPVDREIFRQDDSSPSLQVLAYDGVFKDCRVFCSLGLTHYSTNLNRIAEISLPVDDAWEDIPYLLANALFFMIQKNISVGWGISISGIEHISPQFTATFEKTAIYLTRPFGFPDGFSKVRCHQEIGNVYLATFISAAEHIFFQQHGARQFEALMISKDVDPFSLRRPSCV